MPLPTADEAFGPAPLPTAEEAFGAPAPSQAPQSHGASGSWEAPAVPTLKGTVESLGVGLADNAFMVARLAATPVGAVQRLRGKENSLDKLIVSAQQGMERAVMTPGEKGYGVHIPLIDKSGEKEDIGRLGGGIVGGIGLGLLFPEAEAGNAAKALVAKALTFVGQSVKGAALATVANELPNLVNAKTWDEAQTIVNRMPEETRKNALIGAAFAGAVWAKGRFSQVAKSVGVPEVTESEVLHVAHAVEEDGKVPEAFVKPEYGYEGLKEEATKIPPKPTIPLRTGMAPKAEFLPAIKTAEGVVVGKRGQIHADVAMEHGMDYFLDNTLDLGFSREGKYYTREEATKALAELSAAADKAHAETLIEKGKVEAKENMNIQPTKPGATPPVAGQPRPRAATAGVTDPTPPHYGLLDAFRKYINPIFHAPQSLRGLWDKMWSAMDVEYYDANRNYELTKKVLGNDATDRQAMRYMRGLAPDPKLPALTPTQMQHLEGQRALLDAYFEESVINGVMRRSQYIEDYLPQLWKNRRAAREFYEKRYAGRQGARFNKARLWDDYEAAIKAGLKPVTENFSDLMRIAEHNYIRVNQQAAFFKSIRSTPGLAIPLGKKAAIPAGYRITNIPGLQGYAVESVSARIAENFYNHSRWNESMTVHPFGMKGSMDLGPRQLKNFRNYVERGMLTISGFHHIATVKNALAAGIYHPIAAFREGLRMIEGSDPVIRNGVAQGLRLGGIEDIDSSASAFLRNPFGPLGKYMERGLFEKFIPGLKAFYFRQLAGKMAADNPNLPVERVYKKAAEAANDLFGNKSWERTGRSKTMQDTLRILTFAPDWLETRLGMFYNAVAEAGKTVGVPEKVITPTMNDVNTRANLRNTAAGILTLGLTGELLHQAFKYAHNGFTDKPDDRGSSRRFGEFVIPWVKTAAGNPLKIDPMGAFRWPLEIVTDPIKFLAARKSVLASMFLEDVANLPDFKGDRVRRPEHSLAQNILDTGMDMLAKSLPISFQNTVKAIDVHVMRAKDANVQLAKDLASMTGNHASSDYPSDLRTKLQSHIDHWQAIRSHILALKELGDTAGMKKAAEDFNAEGKELVEEVKKGRFNKQLGPFVEKNIRTMFITR